MVRFTIHQEKASRDSLSTFNLNETETLFFLIDKSLRKPNLFTFAPTHHTLANAY